MKKLILLLTLTMMFGQTKLETRLYSGVEVTPSSNELDFDSIVGFDIGDGRVTLINVHYGNPDQNYDCTFSIRPIIPVGVSCCSGGMQWSHDIDIKSGGFWHSYTPDFPLLEELEYYVYFLNCDEWGVNDLSIDFMITAEFPQEDTGYIEDGFDYCVEPGANLMSYPCDSAVALLDAIPSDALSQFSGIIGQGIAATQLPNGTWVGSLTAMQASSGYWIQSNTALCFNYDCSEN